MATLLANNDSQTASYAYYGSNGRSMQTFTIPSGYDVLEYIDIYTYKTGSPAGNWTLSVYATSGGLPTGSALKTISVTASSVGTGYGWVTMNFTNFTVTPTAKYCFVMAQDSVTSTANAFYLGHAAGSSYSGGDSYYSTNGGSSWSSMGGDWTFRVYGSQSATAPTVTTGSVSSITSAAADVAGNVTSDGGATITQRGICYIAGTGTPTTANSLVVVSGTTGSFTGSITGLAKGSTYTARAYAINSQGTSYGVTAQFTTLTTAPTVTTSGISSISATTSVGGGNVTDGGGETVTERGVCWNTSTNPTTSNSKTVVSGTTGSYSANLTGLTANTLYYVRAYAINTQGTSYGANTTFTTLDTIKLWGQSFTPTSTGTLNRVDLTLRLKSGTSGTAKVRIYSNNGGTTVPDTLLSSAQVTITNTSYQSISFTVNAAVTSGTKYWIVLEDPFVIVSYHIEWGANSSGGYATGEVKYTKSSAPTTWINTSYSSHDAVFTAYVQPSLDESYDLEVKYRKRYL